MLHSSSVSNLKVQLSVYRREVRRGDIEIGPGEYRNNILQAIYLPRFSTRVLKFCFGFRWFQITILESKPENSDEAREHGPYPLKTPLENEKNERREKIQKKLSPNEIT